MQPIQTNNGLFDVGVGQDEQKLLATPTRDQVGTGELSFRSARESLQYAVAHLIAEAVIQLLKVVQVDQSHRQWPGTAHS